MKNMIRILSIIEITRIKTKTLHKTGIGIQEIIEIMIKIRAIITITIKNNIIRPISRPIKDNHFTKTIIFRRIVITNLAI